MEIKVEDVYDMERSFFIYETFAVKFVFFRD